MTPEEKFLQAERSAEQLVNALNELKKETISYKTSKEELEKVGQRLILLIDKFEAIAKDTSETIITVKSIGGPEILKSVDLAKDGIKDEIKSTSSEMKDFIEAKNKGMLKSVDLAKDGIKNEIKDSINAKNKEIQQLNKQISKMNKLIKICLSALIFSLVGVVILLVKNFLF